MFTYKSFFKELNELGVDLDHNDDDMSSSSSENEEDTTSSGDPNNPNVMTGLIDTGGVGHGSEVNEANYYQHQHHLPHQKSTANNYHSSYPSSTRSTAATSDAPQYTNHEMAIMMHSQPPLPQTQMTSAAAGVLTSSGDEQSTPMLIHANKPMVTGNLNYLM